MKHLLISKIIFSIYVLVGIGLADWSDKTPNGNEINNFMGSKILYLKNKKQLKNLSEWYFYKKHVIGTLEKYNMEKRGYDKKEYFIVNEKSFEIKTFKSETEWNNYIKKNKLKPKFWTRWYKHKWSFFEDLLLLIIFGGFIIIIPFFILFFRSVYLSIAREKINIKKLHTRISIIIAVLCFILISFNYLPHSI